MATVYTQLSLFDYRDSKTCKICGKEKSRKEFPRRGLRCKECSNAWHREHYLVAREQVCARTRAYYAAHPEQYQEYGRQRRQDPIKRARDNANNRKHNKTEHHRAYNRAYLRRTRRGNPRWQEYDRLRNQRPERIAWKRTYNQKRNASPVFKKYKHLYRAAHPEQDARQAERKRLHYASSFEVRREHIEANKQWRAEHPLLLTEQSRRRQARKRGVAVSKVSYKAVIERDGYHCYICNQPIDPTIKEGPAKLHFDHIIPLAKHGGHITENITPTHACCNMRKNARLIEQMDVWDRRGPDAS